MAQDIEILPVAYQGNLIDQYVETVSEYMKLFRKGYLGVDHEFRKGELENKMRKMEQSIQCMKTKVIRVPRYYFAKFNRVTYRVDLSKTVNIYSHGRKVIFVYNTGERHETYAKLGDIWNNIKNLLPCFCRISQSYIINLQFVNSFTSFYICVGKQTFHVTSRYRCDVSERASDLQYSGIEWIE